MRHTRRGFLRQTLGAAWTGAALLEQSIFRAAQARAQAPRSASNLFDIQKIADRVYAAIARPEVLINCNAAIFENSQDLLIVDTHSKPSAVSALVAQIRKEVSNKPVRYVVNSHFHWDHSQGTPAYRRLNPRPDVLATEATRRLLMETGKARLDASVEQAKKSLEDYQARLTAAHTAEEKSHYQRCIRDTKAYIAEMKDYAPVLPDITIKEDLILHDAAHDLHLAFRGRGHTSGDVVVYCPQKKVIATGDLLHSFLPYMGDGYPTEWPRTLLHVAGFEFNHVIGGHGAVQEGKQRLYQMASYIEEMTEAVVTGKRAGKGLTELQKEITPGSLRSLSRQDYGEFLRDSLRRYRLQPPGVDMSAVISTTVADNVGQIHATLERS